MPLRPDQVATAIKTGGSHKLADGHNLYLVTRRGRGYWVLQYRDGAAIRSKGLGSAATTSPAKARQAREAFMVQRRAEHGRRPSVRPRAPRTEAAPAAGVLFSQAAATYLADHASEWSAKTLARFHALLRMYAGPLDPLPVASITVQQVANMLKPIWSGPGSNRGSKLRGLVEQILAAQEVADNPASWSRLRHKLNRKAADTVSHPALPYPEVPALMRELAGMSSVQARMLRYTILTATRQNEALGMMPAEIDKAAKTWTVPAERMKPTKDNKRYAHTVPLSDAALACLGEQDDGKVFPIGRTAVRRLLQSFKRTDAEGRAITLHGFRSTFTDWAAEAGYSSELREMALSHAVGDEVEQAYMRTKLVEQRRPMMDAWAAFATTTDPK